MRLIKQQRRVLRIPPEYMKDAPPAPRSVKIEITPRCNYRCQYCVFTLRPAQPTQDMDFEFFKKITTEMKNIGVEEIGPFYIGESFMNPKLLIECVKWLKQDLQFPYVFLTSNASLAKPEYVEEVMRAGLDSLKWSCNANHKQFQEYIGVSEKVLDIALDNIKSAYAIRNNKGFETEICASSIMYDDQQPKKMAKFLKDNIRPYVDWHYWLPLYSGGGDAIEQEQGLGTKPVAGNPGRCDDPVEPLPCWTIFTAAHVMANGTLTACCLDGTGKFGMGNLYDKPFMDCWNSKEFKALRSAHLKKNVSGTICERCVLGG